MKERAIKRPSLISRFIGITVAGALIRSALLGVAELLGLTDFYRHEGHRIYVRANGTSTLSNEAVAHALRKNLSWP